MGSEELNIGIAWSLFRLKLADISIFVNGGMPPIKWLRLKAELCLMSVFTSSDFDVSPAL